MITLKEHPYKITNEIISLVSEISELIGRATVSSQLDKNPTLRRRNRIHTIYSSLAIEQNTLSLEQVTDVINGKRIIAPPKDIEEVKNAYEIYELLDTLDPYSMDDLLKAHGVMMRGLTAESGEFRSGAVGVVDAKTGAVIHLGTLPQYVPQNVENLLSWARESELHMLIKSCVFHYEFELIHPFSDGTGRIVRIWQTLMLSKHNPIFAWLPVESMIHDHQEEYYKAINYCNNVCESTAFITFMLEMIKAALEETTVHTDQVSDQVTDQDVTPVKRLMTALGNDTLSCAQLMERLNISHRPTFRKNYLNPALEKKLIERTVPDKPNSRNQKYRKCKGATD